MSQHKDWKNWIESEDSTFAKITPIDSFCEYLSPFGCCNLSGLLWEWMIDLWNKNKDFRVNRGGAFAIHRSYIRLAYRLNQYPEAKYDDLGFRLARTF